MKILMTPRMLTMKQREVLEAQGIAVLMVMDGIDSPTVLPEPNERRSTWAAMTGEK